MAEDMEVMATTGRRGVDGRDEQRAWKPPSAKRVPINIHPEARDALRELLWTDEMRGVGYSEFIMRAIAAQGAVEAIKALPERVGTGHRGAREAAYAHGYRTAVADALEALVGRN